MIVHARQSVLVTALILAIIAVAVMLAVGIPADAVTLVLADEAIAEKPLAAINKKGLFTKDCKEANMLCSQFACVLSSPICV